MKVNNMIGYPYIVGRTQSRLSGYFDNRQKRGHDPP